MSSVDANFFLVYVWRMITATDLRRFRVRCGETQAQFAKRFGVSRTTLLNWETRGPPASGPALPLIERVLAELLQIEAKEAAE
jgi:DNA-binding transcriptional regulator YiaG